MRADEVYVFKAQVLDGRGAPIPYGQGGGIGVIHKSPDHQVLDALDDAPGVWSAAVHGEGVVHGHGEAVFNQDMGAAAEVIGVVMILLLAVDDFDVAGGEVLGAEHVHGPIGAAQEQQVLEGNIAAVVDRIAPDACPVRVDHFPFGVSAAPVGSGGLKVMPQLRVAVHVDGAPSGQTGILNLVDRKS